MRADGITACVLETMELMLGPLRLRLAGAAIRTLLAFQSLWAQTDPCQSIHPYLVRSSTADVRPPREDSMIPLHDDNPTERTPVVTITFIVTCIFVFLYQASLSDKFGELFVFQYGAIPAAVFGQADLSEDVSRIPAYATLLTSMFLHGGWMHLLGNMLYLWVFGDNIEDRLGHFRYLVFYLLCGLAAGIVQ